MDEDDDKVWDSTHQECCLQWLPFFLESVEPPDVWPDHFQLSWQFSILISKWGFFPKAHLQNLEQAPQTPVNANHKNKDH